MIIAVVVIIALIGGGIIYFSNDSLPWGGGNGGDTNGENGGEGSRVIYGLSATPEQESSWRFQCENLGGTFNTCGSPCPPDAENCIAVCAFTCENIK